MPKYSGAKSRLAYQMIITLSSRVVRLSSVYHQAIIKLSSGYADGHFGVEEEGEDNRLVMREEHGCHLLHLVRHTITCTPYGRAPYYVSSTMPVIVSGEECSTLRWRGTVGRVT